MKKSNRLLVKGMAMLLAVLMVLAIVPVVFAATIDHTESFELSYNTESDVPEIIYTVNAEKLGEILATRELTKADVEGFIPDVLLNVYRTHELPSLDELFDLIPNEVINSTEAGKLIPGQLMRDPRYFTVDFVDELLGADTLKNAVKSVLNAHQEILNTLLTDENCKAIKNANVLTEDELRNLLTGYTGTALPTEDEAFDWILANNRSALVDLLFTKMDAVLNVIGVDTAFDAIDPNLIIDELGGMQAIYNKADKAVLKAKIKDVAKKLIAGGDLTKVSLTNQYGDTDVVYAVNNGLMEANLTALMNFILKSIPEPSDFAVAKDGSTVLSVRGDVSFITGETSGFSFVVKLVRDTANVNHYAHRLSTMLNYICLDGNFTVNISDLADEAVVVFSKIIEKGLATDRLTVDEKAKIISIYTKKGEDLITALEELDFSRWIDDETNLNYMNTIREWGIKIIRNIVDDYANFSIAEGYVGNGKIILDPTLSVETDPIVTKICEKLGIDKNDIPITYENVVNLELDVFVDMKDVYELTFVNKDGDVIYKTLMAAGVKMSDILTILGASLGTAAPDGWVDPNGAAVDTMPSADLTLRPKTDDPNPPKPMTYTVKFMADGKLVATRTYKAGDTILPDIPKVPNKVGYAGKWQSFRLGNSNLVVNAIYTAKTYTIRYDANGGVGTMPIQVAVYDRNVALTPCTFVRDGYRFIGWNTAADGSGASYADKAVVKNLINVNGMMLYAQWEEVKANVYTVTFMANGEVVEKVTYEEGATKLSKVPAVPARAGYTGAWEAYSLNNSDITVNAQYTANTYNVIFNANGGTGTMVNVTMTYDIVADLPANAFTYAGYTFAGWNTAADGKGTSYAAGATVKNLAENGDVTLYAQWNEAAPVESTDATTTPADDAKGTNVALIVVLSVVAVAVIGGAVAFFVMKKKH